MRFVLETKLGKLKIKDISLKTSFEDWCLDHKKECLNKICEYEWKETNQGIVVYGQVWLGGLELKQIPFKFYKIFSGHFKIFDNLLTSLVGSPEYVEEDFVASINKLQNLNGGPKRVDGSYKVSRNQINSLEGAPEFVGEDFWIPNQGEYGKQWTEEEIREKIEVEGEVWT